MPTMDEALRMHEEAKRMAEAAETNVTPIKEEPEQLGLFEDEPVHAYKASLTAAGWMKIDNEIKVGANVAITAEGHVSKIVFHKKNGVLTRQHIIVVDAETAEIKPL